MSRQHYVKGMNARTGTTILFRTGPKRILPGIVPDDNLVRMNHALNMNNEKETKDKACPAKWTVAYVFCFSAAIVSFVFAFIFLMMGKLAHAVDFGAVFIVSALVTRVLSDVVRQYRLFHYDA